MFSVNTLDFMFQEKIRVPLAAAWVRANRRSAAAAPSARLPRKVPLPFLEI